MEKLRDFAQGHTAGFDQSSVFPLDSQVVYDLQPCCILGLIPLVQS